MILKTRTSHPEPRIWSSVVRGLLLPLAENNVDPSALLIECGIDEADLQKPHGEIPLKKYLRFIEGAARTAGDPLLGMRLARSAGPETLGALGFLFLSSRTLFEAMNNFCVYMNLLQDATYVQLRRDAHDLTFCYQLYHVSDVDSRQDVEFSLALTCRLVRIYSGPGISISAVNFRHSASATKGEYERLLKAPVFFGQDTNSVVLPSAFAQTRSKVFDAGLSPILQGFLDEELLRRKRIQTFTDQVSRALMDGNVAHPVTAAKVARNLGVSEPTLYRRLKAEATTFANIVDTMNYDIARQYLSDSSLSITQIAHLIGFSESASFTRAFARWSNGNTPSQFRKALRTQNGQPKSVKRPQRNPLR